MEYSGSASRNQEVRRRRRRSTAVHGGPRRSDACHVIHLAGMPAITYRLDTPTTQANQQATSQQTLEPFPTGAPNSSCSSKKAALHSARRLEAKTTTPGSMAGWVVPHEIHYTDTSRGLAAAVQASARQKGGEEEKKPSPVVDSWRCKMHALGCLNTTAAGP